MDVPVKKLVRLLHADQPAEVRGSAVLVFTELGIKDAEASAELIARLDDPEPVVRVFAIKAAGKLKLTKALPVLLERIRGGGEEANLAAAAAAKLGSEGVKGLQGLMSQVAPGLRRYIAAALTGAAGAGGAEAGLAVLLDKDPQVATAAANAMIGRIPTTPPDQKKALVAELVAVASDKKKKLPPTAEMPVVRVLASLNDPAAADVLWERVLPPFSSDVRAAALHAVGGWLQAPTKEQWRRLFACAVEPDFHVAAPALVLLSRLPVTAKQEADWLALFNAPDAAARRLALDKVGDRDTPEVAAALMAQLAHHDRQLRDAARAKLAGSESGRAALLTALKTEEAQDELWALAKLVAPHAKSFPAKSRGEILTRALAYLEADDHRVDPLVFLLKEADAAGLRDDMLDRAAAKRKKKDYATALKYLKLLARDPSVGLPVRLGLALCGLRLSAKEVAMDARQNDACLRQFAHCLAADAAETQTAVEKAKWLEPEDLFYLGFHFSEHFHQEKAFGVAVLQHLVKSSPKSKVAASAKNKLKAVVVK